MEHVCVYATGAGGDQLYLISSSQLFQHSRLSLDLLLKAWASDGSIRLGALVNICLSKLGWEKRFNEDLLSKDSALNGARLLPLPFLRFKNKYVPQQRAVGGRKGFCGLHVTDAFILLSASRYQWARLDWAQWFCVHLHGKGSATPPWALIRVPFMWSHWLHMSMPTSDSFSDPNSDRSIQIERESTFLLA